MMEADVSVMWAQEPRNGTQGKAGKWIPPGARGAQPCRHGMQAQGDGFWHLFLRNQETIYLCVYSTKVVVIASAAIGDEYRGH